MSQSNLISHQIDNMLQVYSKQVEGVMKTALEEEAQETADELKATSPKRAKGSKRGAYGRSWGVTKRGDTYIVHNKQHYRLTHLLENGHVIRNGVGTFGRVGPIKHIEPALHKAEQRLPERIEERLK